MASLAEKWLDKSRKGSFSKISKVAFSSSPKKHFDAEHWRHQIVRAINKAMQQDKGALSYCAEFMPEVSNHYMQTANSLDAAYTTQDAKLIRQAIRTHDLAAENTRKAAASPLSADQLSPAECSKFCQAHLLSQGGRCPHINHLDGCVLWEAKKKRLQVSHLPVKPYKYLDCHNKHPSTRRKD